MRIAWLSPLPPSGSALAAPCVSMLASVRQWAEISVWTQQESWDPLPAEIATVRRLDPRNVSWLGINRADMTVVHLGDDGESLLRWRIAQLHRAVVVLHQSGLVHLFGAAEDADRSALRSWMEERQGFRGSEDFAALLAGRTEGLDARYAFSELATEGALAVVPPDRASSSEALCQAVAQACRRRPFAAIDALQARIRSEILAWSPPSRQNAPPHVAQQIRTIERESEVLGERMSSRIAGLARLSEEIPTRLRRRDGEG